MQIRIGNFIAYVHLAQGRRPGSMHSSDMTLPPRGWGGTEFRSIGWERRTDEAPFQQGSSEWDVDVLTYGCGVKGGRKRAQHGWDNNGMRVRGRFVIYVVTVQKWVECDMGEIDACCCAGQIISIGLGDMSCLGSPVK